MDMNIKFDNILILGFFVLILLIVVFQAFWMFKTEKRLKRFFLGKKAKDLEDTITLLEDNIKLLNS